MSIMKNIHKLSIGASLSLTLLFGFTYLPLKNQTFPDNQYIIVTLMEARVIDKNGIGNEWFFSSNIENTTLYQDIPYKTHLAGKTKIDITSSAIEEDPSSDDIGTNILTITPSNLNQLVSSSLITRDVFVKEYHGKGAGKTATCMFRYKINVVKNEFANLK